MKPLMLAVLASLSLGTAAFAAEAAAPAQKQETPDSRQQLADQIAELEKTDPKDSYLARLTTLDVEKQIALRNGDQERAKIITEEIASVQAAVGAGSQELKPEDGRKKPAVMRKDAPEETEEP